MFIKQAIFLRTSCKSLVSTYRYTTLHFDVTGTVIQDRNPNRLILTNDNPPSG
jgi:hypothetical protein